MSYSLISKTILKARTAHWCIWCGEAIFRGESYVHEASKYSGDLQDHRWHHECQKASGEWFHDIDEEFTPYSFKRGTIDER
jgi:hypothetical protein